MALSPVKSAALTKNNSVTPVVNEQPKQVIPLWMIFFILFLVLLVVGMGMYIGFQQGLFQKRTSSVVPPQIPTPASESASVRVSTVLPGPDWLMYHDEQTGLTLKYPSTILLNTGGKGSTQMILSVSIEPIDNIPEELPLGMGRKEAIADRASLEKGIAQTIGDWAASDALVRIGGTYNGRMTSVLSRFEVCSVLFSRKLVFYPGNYRVMISLDGDEETVMASMPEFFTVDPTNCGEQNMWNRERMGEFMQTLAKGEGRGAAQLWYDTFSAILKTIELVPAAGSVSPTTSTSAQTCEVTDRAFCNVLTDIKNSMAARNYDGVIAYQNMMTVTCDPEGMFVAICEGAAKGAIKEGYSIGYNQSEGTVQTRSGHLASISSYMVQNGPFIYKGSLQSGDKGVIVYLNSDASKLFVLYMKRTGSTWRFDSVLVGGTFGDTSFATLSPSLLDMIR